MNEYRVKVTVRNNLLLSAIEAAGYKSQADFERSAGIRYGGASQFISLRARPINQDGEFKPVAKQIMEVLGAAPSDLWTDQQLMMKLKTNTGERTIGEDQVQYILENHLQAMTLPNPEDAAENAETVDIVAHVLDSLTKREANALRLRFGIGCDEHTLEEAGKVLNVTRERMRQIEAKALRKLRMPGERQDALNKAMGK